MLNIIILYLISNVNDFSMYDRRAFFSYLHIFIFSYLGYRICNNDKNILFNIVSNYSSNFFNSYMRTSFRNAFIIRDKVLDLLRN